MISKDKQYRTRGGLEVRIYAIDGRGDFSIHGAVKTEDGWMCCAWHKDGYRILEDYDDAYDIFEVKPRHKRTVWLNVYPRASNGWSSRELADQHAGGRIACIKVDLDFQEGEGL